MQSNCMQVEIVLVYYNYIVFRINVNVYTTPKLLFFISHNLAFVFCMICKYHTLFSLHQTIQNILVRNEPLFSSNICCIYQFHVLGVISVYSYIYATLCNACADSSSQNYAKSLAFLKKSYDQLDKNDSRYRKFFLF
jgi:hypothetical protein